MTDQQLTVPVVDDLLAEHAAEALNGRANDLTVQGQRVDHPPDIVDHDIVQDLDMARSRIDGDVRDGGAIGVGRLGAVRE